MSLKDNVAMVRDELNSEEKMFENAVRAERFVKKYKGALIAAVVLLVLGVAANIVYEMKQAGDTKEANIALSQLEKDPQDSAAAQTLQNLRPQLFGLWQLSNALKSEDINTLKTLSTSANSEVADSASYHAAVIARDLQALNSYVAKPQAIYKDLALLELAMLYIEKGDTESAQGKLKMISKESPLYRSAQPLMHYGVK